MTVRELREEIEARLMLKPRSALELARSISSNTPALGTEVLILAAGMQDQGSLIEIDGKLYVQRQWAPEA